MRTARTSSGRREKTTANKLANARCAAIAQIGGGFPGGEIRRFHTYRPFFSVARKSATLWRRRLRNISGKLRKKCAPYRLVTMR